MSRWTIGNIGVDRVAELEGPLVPPAAVFPDYDPEILVRHGEDLVPAHYLPELGLVVGTVQSYVIRTGTKTILVDTCCGNGKNRPHDPGFHDLNVPYIERLAQVGVRPEEVDFVFCTHLHVDHAGWNTRLENGRWVPTFPHATYLFSQSELEFVQAAAKAGGPQDLFSLIYEDSVLPVIEARRSRLLTEEGPWLPGLEFAFTPGHTPGHVILRANSRGETALFVGDVVQHPLQVYRPDWNSVHCAIPEQSRATRRRVLGECADHGHLMFPAHFAAPYAVRVRRDQDNFSLA